MRFRFSGASWPDARSNGSLASLGLNPPEALSGERVHQLGNSFAIRPEVKRRRPGGGYLAMSILMDDHRQPPSRSATLNDVGAHCGVPNVIADQQYGTRLAIEHLLSLGHQQIACVTGPPLWSAL